MEKENTIFRELSDLNSPLASIPATHVFNVPPGYFEHLPACILLQAKLQETAPATYTVPAGYFEQLPATVLLQTAIREKAAPTYTVPAGYFEQLPGQLLQHIHPATITASEEIQQLSPLLAGLQNRNPYTLPAGYFEEQPVAETAATALFAVPPVTSPLRKKRSRWIQYSAAAVIAGIALVSGARMFRSDHTSGTSPNSQNVSAEIARMSDADIVHYLESTTSGYIEPVIESDAGGLASDDLIKLASDKEIEQYLAENADPKDAS
jgi:hypothetical protein